MSGPLISAFMICAPPTPKSGRIATEKTMSPMPPIQARRHRQPLMDIGSPSMSVIMVAPVVVRHDIVSKNASIKLYCGRYSMIGSVAAAAIAVQESVTTRKPCCAVISRLNFQKAIVRRRPIVIVAAADCAKTKSAPSAL